MYAPPVPQPSDVYPIHRESARRRLLDEVQGAVAAGSSSSNAHRKAEQLALTVDQMEETIFKSSHNSADYHQRVHLRLETLKKATDKVTEKRNRAGATMQQVRGHSARGSPSA